MNSAKSSETIRNCNQTMYFKVTTNNYRFVLIFAAKIAIVIQRAQRLMEVVGKRAILANCRCICRIALDTHTKSQSSRRRILEMAMHFIISCNQRVCNNDNNSSNNKRIEYCVYLTLTKKPHTYNYVISNVKSGKGMSKLRHCRLFEVKCFKVFIPSL